MTTAILIVVALVFAVLRIGGVVHPSFQAFAHLFTGGLFAVGCVTWWHNGWKSARRDLALAVGLSVVELGCFLFLPHS